MREIKFRVWLKQENRMEYLGNAGLQYFDFEGSYALSFVCGGYPQFWAHECYESIKPKYELMQFTGLKDKNGKEIYEGDIVEMMAGCVRIIVWDGGCFHSRVNNWESKKDMPSHPIHFWSMNEDLLPEVIGNIYENRSLLNSDKNVQECDATGLNQGTKS